MTEKQQNKKYKTLKNINSDRHDHEGVVTDETIFASDEEEHGAGSTKGQSRTKRGNWEKEETSRLVDF